jgi:hypothetical protein
MRNWLLLLPLTALWGQSEEALRAYFEGKHVQSRVDLPGTHLGLDIHYRKQPPADLKALQRRLNEWGPAIRPGADILVTAVRVKGKNIEFQLGGGGLHESSSVDYPTNVPRSRREEELDRDVRKETDPRRKDALKRDLDRLRSRREQEERRLRAEKARLEEMKKFELREKAYRYGSRINLWFEKEYLKESVPTPEQLISMLEEWVDFSPMNRRPAGRRPGAVAPQQPQQPPPSRSGSATSLRRGMEADEVHRLLGDPERYKESKQGTVLSRTEAFEMAAETIEVDYVEGLVVRWRVTSK